jgi:dienelactone hydrolase
MKYYQSKSYLNSRFQTIGLRMGFKATNLDEWQVWRQDLHGILFELLGLDRMVSTPLNPRITEEVQRDGFRRQRVEIDTEPGVTMPFYVLIPDNLNGKVPALIATHGHVSGGKVSPAGAIEFPGVAEKIKEFNYDYGAKCAQRGYLVCCPDARAFGERRESLYEGDEFYFANSCNELANMALPLGMTVAGIWTWGLIRLLDYIPTPPECQGQKIGCIGLSGGGLQCLYLSALDERVACAIDSGYFYGVKDALLNLPNCDCNYVPHLWEYVDMGDLGAMIAPRAFMIESGTNDGLNGSRGIINTIEQFEITQKAYDLLGVPEKAYQEIFEGVHRWNGVAAYPWIDRWLKG